MKSVKPGRGPSMMGAFGSAAAALFGVFWTIGAASMGAPGFFVAFGFIFIAIGVAQAIYNFKNATSQNRYSAFDITDGNEEPDPLNEFFGGGNENPERNRNASTPEASSSVHDEMSVGDESEKAFCPYCGAEVEKDFTYCMKCGKKLPQ